MRLRPSCQGQQDRRQPTGVRNINNQLSQDEIIELRKKLEELRVEHRDLDDVIHHLTESAYPDQLQISRLKKRKLRLKDLILRIESMLIPDLDA